MIARIGELYEKEVICIKDGSRLGNVGDVEINTCTGSAESIIVLGKRRFFRAHRQGRRPNNTVVLCGSVR